VGAYFLLEKLHAGAPGLFRRARAMGLTTSLDCNHDPSGKWDSNLLATLRHTDFFFPNEVEALSITGESSVEAAASRLGRSVPAVLVKMGARGVYLFSAGRGRRIPAKRVRVVDTTGAGDSFNAGFLASLFGGGTLEECAEAGLSAAARCLTRVGGTEAFQARQ
jgi:ribokinase